MYEHKANSMSGLPTLFFVGILLSILIYGCATTPEEPGSKPIERTHFSLLKGDAVKASSELPVYYPVWVVWYRGEVEVSRELGFRAWDFNGDGRIDMVEALSRVETPEVTARAYDFHFEGAIDLYEEYGKKGELRVD